LLTKKARKLAQFRWPKEENRPNTYKNRQNLRKTCGKRPFRLDFTHPQAALFSTTGFSGPAWIQGFERSLPPLEHLMRNIRQQPRQRLAAQGHAQKENKIMATGMTKTALTRQMAEKLEMTNKQSAAFLDMLAETAIKETKKNGVFIIPGIGRLVKAERKARIGRNPQTGQPIKIKAKTVVKFRVAKAAKDVIAPTKK
jgi:DNA-binding protein HU-beta